MGWKIFFWIYFILTLLSFLTPPESPSLMEIAGYPIALLEVVALYTYAYKKNILPAKRWVLLFWVYICFTGLMVLGEFTPLGTLFPLIKANVFSSLVGAAKITAIVVTIGLFIPIFYVLLRLAFPKIYKD